MKRREFLHLGSGAVASVTLLLTAGSSILSQTLRKKDKGTVSFITRELLGRPTNKSIIINAEADTDLDIYFEYGTAPADYTQQTPTSHVIAKNPINMVIDNLQPNIRYYYRMRYKDAGTGTFAAGPEHSFHTARGRGNAFCFAVQADPHLDENSNIDTYRNSLQNVFKDQPDFLIDLGDTSMAEKLGITPEGVTTRTLLLRNEFEKIAHSVPLFLAIGNHEGENGWQLDGTANKVAVYGTNTRKRYFPNPKPDAFYTGETKSYDFVGVRESYYAWHWGNALFVVLDPYWHTTKNAEWGWSLGIDQYTWFKDTLEKSNAGFKFVFCHQLVGGLELNGKGRGGIEAVPFYEMGGNNSDGSWGFTTNRPGWAKPIHQLMVDNKVSIFFHGHDHFYAKQELDGIVYQEMPQPSLPKYDTVGNSPTDYGYLSGVILPNSGHLRVTVNSDQALVEYVRAYHQENSGSGWVNGKVSHSYTVKASNSSIQTNTSSANSYSLRQVKPYSLSTYTAVSFCIPHAGIVSLTIYSVTGRMIKNLTDMRYEPGVHTVSWDGNDETGSACASGRYMCHMNVENISKSIILQKF